MSYSLRAVFSQSVFQPDIIKAFTSKGHILALTELFLGKSEDQVNILLSILHIFPCAALAKCRSSSGSTPSVCPSGQPPGT